MMKNLENPFTAHEFQRCTAQAKLFSWGGEEAMKKPRENGESAVRIQVDNVTPGR